MSELERRKGIIKLIPEVDTDQLSWIEKIEKLQELGYVFEEVTEELEDAYCPELVFVQGKWWKIDSETIDPYGSFVEIQPLGFGCEVYFFDCQWYNGGACFEEVLEGGFENA